MENEETNVKTKIERVTQQLDVAKILMEIEKVKLETVKLKKQVDKEENDG